MSDRLEQIMTKAEEMIRLQNEVAALERQLKYKQEKLSEVAEKELPLMMAEIGLNQFELSDGIRLRVKPILIVNRPSQAGMWAAEHWLDNHGHNGMVKTFINVTLGKDPKQLGKITDELKKLNIPYDVKKDINWQTLNAWGREMEGDGKVIPEDIFTVMRKNVTVIEDNRS